MFQSIALFHPTTDILTPKTDIFCWFYEYLQQTNSWHKVSEHLIIQPQSKLLDLQKQI